MQNSSYKSLTFLFWNFLNFTKLFYNFYGFFPKKDIPADFAVFPVLSKISKKNPFSRKKKKHCRPNSRSSSIFPRPSVVWESVWSCVFSASLTGGSPRHTPPGRSNSAIDSTAARQGHTNRVSCPSENHRLPLKLFKLILPLFLLSPRSC